MGDQLLKAALWYQAQGFSVIPVQGNKRPFIDWKPHQTEKADAGQIRMWWKKYPEAGVGIVTGAISNLSVVDADTADGVNAVEGTLPDAFVAPTVQTPRGGRHYYFRHQAGLVNRAGVIDGVDVRTDGGYIIAPPSKNGKGNYSWLRGLKISEVAPPAMPELLFKNINKHSFSSTRGGSIVDTDHSCPQTSTGVHIGFTKGHRDETLFSVAHHLAKGGMPEPNMLEVLNFFASKCDPPFSPDEVKTKIQSALNRLDTTERNLSTEVREWVLSTGGHFLSTEVYNCLQLSTRRERKTVSTILARLLEENIIERAGSKNGQFRRIEDDCPTMDFLNAETETVDLWLPFALHNLVETMPGNIILLSGEPNAGKTGLILNIIRNNMATHQIDYFNSEMGGGELRKRLSKFEDLPLRDWKFHPWERSDNFADVIKPGPGRINIIDFLEIHDDFYRIGGMIAAIHKKLHGAIAIIALQKNAGTDMGLGGFRTLEKPRLALAMAPGKLKIIKAKNWQSTENPNGMEVHFKIVQGCNFIQTKGWHRA